MNRATRRANPQAAAKTALYGGALAPSQRITHPAFADQILSDLDVAAGTLPGNRRAAFRRLARALPQVPKESWTPELCAGTAEELRAVKATAEEAQTTDPTSPDTEEATQ